ncbi:hypothetical protein POJ06DRAFT_284428 [Lipomyces tetrasporus]|uniref:Uncharacterized protein n=1 Tax=Lipomyces tetrasporus TaxID=54092 RepID=A0AAD7R0U8_9ASCO|nr:uncharacterized protein POJ06DRAFT_284428 [Lipomyces tetrasporus]KAJ8103592.1 hypothetical protein POJ06DRAFT_284428 [Lipomyces tetrasporus]
MEHLELLDTVRRPLSPDSQIEIPASRSESVQEILEEEGAKFPRLQYDGVRKVAIVSAAPSPLHGVMIVDKTPRLDENIKDRLSSAHDYRNTKDTGDIPTTRNWDGALQYRTAEGLTLMVAVEVGLTQSHASLRAAISFSVCALRCRVGIAMCISQGVCGKRPPTKYYATLEEKMAAIQEVERVLRPQLRANSFGPLKIGADTGFGKVTTVVLETYRLEDETSQPDTLLNPTQSFTIVDDGRFVGGEVPANLEELILGDCIPTHILGGNNIAATPVNFFHQDWFEESFRSAMSKGMMQSSMSSACHTSCGYRADTNCFF